MGACKPLTDEKVPLATKAHRLGSDNTHLHIFSYIDTIFIESNEGTIYIDVYASDLRTVIDKLPIEYGFSE